MKKYTHVILLCVLFCFMLTGCKNEKGSLAEKELSDFVAKDIASFQVTLRPPDEKITITDEEKISELIAILNIVTIYDQDDSFREYVGQWVEFELTMTDGSLKNIVAYNPFIIIDSIGYKTEYEPCEELNAFGNRLLEDS